MNLQEKQAYVQENLHYVPEEELKLFKKNFARVFAKNSSCFETNQTISLEDTVAITKGYPVQGIDENLKRKVYNNYRAYRHMLELIEEGRTFDADLIKDLHEEVLNGFEGGGLYRNTMIHINGSKYVPCDPIKIYKRMTKYFDEFDFGGKKGLELASFAHMQLAKIHPFLDGNGRVGRLVLNYVLIKEGYLPISIPVKRRNEYFDLLELYKTGTGAEQVDKNNPLPFAEFLEELENKEYDRLIDLIDHFKK